MVSDSQKQKWKDCAEKHWELAEGFEEDEEWEKVRKHYVMSANYHEKLSDNVDTPRLAGAHAAKANRARSRAEDAKEMLGDDAGVVDNQQGSGDGGVDEDSGYDLSEEERDLLTRDGEEWSDLSEKQKEFRLKVHTEIGPMLPGIDVEDDSGSSGSGSKRSPGRARGSGGGDNGVGPESFFEESPAMSLDDVGGLEEVKHRFHEDVVFPLENREFYDRHGVGIVNGVLMYGPPGTGKTYTARGVAGELGVPFAEVSPAQMSSKMVGEAADLVRELFEEARDLGECVVFLDEVDSLANSRDGEMQQTRSERQAVTQLLEEMERVQGSDVLVVAATNLKDDVDGAMLRSGRFSTHIEVPVPDRETRAAVFRKHLEDKETAGEFEVEFLAEVSEGFSCSDVAGCVGRAARSAARESAEQGVLQPLEYRHLLQAVKQCEPSLSDWPGYM